MTGTGIYVHLPFCPYLCPYCDFAKWMWNDERAAAYLAALRAEIAVTATAQARTLFFGGGTPTLYSPAAIAQIIDDVRARFALPLDAEITSEANPDPALPNHLPALRAAGVNRLSIGVQTFDADELRVTGRRHSAADVVRAVAAGRAAGFENISLDLIFAIPGQTETSWAGSLQAAIDLGVEHISCYGLTVEAGTPYATWFAREPAAFADDTREAAFYAQAIAMLGAAGFEQYEISNWARPGFRCRHNAGYWANDDYIGLGVSAASYRDGTRSVHTRELATYIESAGAGLPIPGESEHLTGEARLGEAIMLALRTAEGVDLALFRERYGTDVAAHYAPVVDDMVGGGMLVRTADALLLTERGRFVANDVCGAFLAD